MSDDDMEGEFFLFEPKTTFLLINPPLTVSRLWIRVFRRGAGRGACRHREPILQCKGWVGSEAEIRSTAGLCGPLAMIRESSPGLKDAEDPREALDGFHQVVSMEGEKGEW
jgi:hypothetical protein